MAKLFWKDNNGTVALLTARLVDGSEGKFSKIPEIGTYIITFHPDRQVQTGLINNIKTEPNT